jgi:hypothetical protein
MVERAIRSVRAQRAPATEVIVVDDASDDDTGERAAAHGAQVITHKRNMGEGASRNTGLRAAGTEWVALLDSDDEWLPTHLETVWADRDGHVLVGSAMLVTGGEGVDHRVQGWTGTRPRVLNGPADVALPENKLPASAVLVRREAVLDAGGFRDLRRASDLDMWVRVLEGGSGVAIPRVTALYHVHPDQVSTDARQMHEAHRAVIAAHADRAWCTRRLQLRSEGVIAWDAARGAWAAGAPRMRTAIALGTKLARPQRAAAVVQLLAGRFRARRLATRFRPGGGPSTAILPGAVVDSAPPQAVIDLRDRSVMGALLYLARRPAARALVRGRALGLAVRALGVQPVRPPRSGAA